MRAKIGNLGVDAHAGFVLGRDILPRNDTWPVPSSSTHSFTSNGEMTIMKR